MRFSHVFCPTLKEDPNDAEIASHTLLLRAGFIKKVASGIYSYLPMGLRVMRKIESIVRDEMNSSGAQELDMPLVVPGQLWQESGRWEKYGPELLRLKDRHGVDYCLGPTHEEVITALTRNTIRSYRDMPVNLYQIQRKFRDEIRPRFGLMRGREFVMKDAYSFHSSQECLETTYLKMRDAYCAIFSRCGLDYRIVEADSGSIGGSVSAEFMVLAQTGEDMVVEAGEYAANIEAVVLNKPEVAPTTESTKSMEKLHTPNCKTIADLAVLLNVDARECLKTMVMNSDGKLVLVLLRGDHELNVIKLKRHLQAEQIEPAEETSVRSALGAGFGSLGPVSVPEDIPIYADFSVMEMTEFSVGANQDNYHFINVVQGRDFTVSEYGDFRFPLEGDPSPVDGAELKFVRGIEVGHIFQLGNVYSKTMGANYLDQNGKSQVIEMGCYGIGVGRTMAAAVEQCHDEKGIVWPLNIAPYHVNIIVPSMKDEAIVSVAEELYGVLSSHNIEVIFDDRSLSAGIKFKDSELIGFPIQVVVGKQYKESQQFELSTRLSGEKVLVSMDNIVDVIQSHINK
jgi:prolyl-tRNA synthetase